LIIFFDERIINNIKAETNLFSAQKDITQPASVTGLEIQQFLGICIWTSIQFASLLVSCGWETWEFACAK
jgi:hypothetical protein